MPMRAHIAHAAAKDSLHGCTLTICGVSCRRSDSTTTCRGRPDIGRLYARRANENRYRPHSCESREYFIMARPPATLQELADHFGPHPNYLPPGGWQDESSNPADRLVKTHCCFCGQQCGIQLKVRHDKVIGFEP